MPVPANDMMVRAICAAAFVSCLGVLACHGTEGGRELRPLHDPEHVDDVLVERSSLALRPTHDGNRFLSGWRPLRRRGGPVLAASGKGARIELVHLAARPRTLALDLEDATFDPAGRLEVRAAGRDLGAVPFADPLEIALPPDLPRGRVLVELAPRGAPFRVRDGVVRPALPAGEASWDGDELVQSGFSRADFVRRVAPGTALVGRFAVPSSARTDQRFLLHVESEDGSTTTAFEWSLSVLDRLRRSRPFEIPLGDGGLVRVSLEARGQGPPGRWSGLALASPATPEVPPPATPSVEPPDVVVLYVMDALRAGAVTHLGGRPGTTPVIDRLAAEGVSFRRHRSAAPNTLPSTKALLTGVAPAEHGGWKLPADGVATLAELWRRAGYRTGLFSGNAWVGPAYGVDRGFEQVTEIPVDVRAPYNDNAERLHEAALGWLETLAPDQRVFLYVHVVHPHNPYDPPEPWRSRLTRGVESTIDGSTRTLLDVSRRRLEPDDADRERLRRLYLGGLAYDDAQLGRWLGELRRLYPGRRLLAAVTADHGEELFDHGGVLHGYTLYEEMIRIPLVIWSPGLVVPGEVTRSTGTLDLHATLADLASRAGAPAAASEGRSLLPLLLSADGRRGGSGGVHLAAAASVKGGIYSIQDGSWKLVWGPRTGLDWGLGGGPGRSRSPEYLFDLREDPRELRNRAGEGGLEAAWLRSRLRAWIAAKKGREKDDGEAEVDSETRRRLEALGYVD